MQKGTLRQLARGLVTISLKLIKKGTSSLRGFQPRFSYHLLGGVVPFSPKLTNPHGYIKQSTGAFEWPGRLRDLLGAARGLRDTAAETAGARPGAQSLGGLLSFHLLKLCFFPLLVLQGNFHYWKNVFFFFQGS